MEEKPQETHHPSNWLSTGSLAGLQRRAALVTALTGFELTSTVTRTHFDFKSQPRALLFNLND